MTERLNNLESLQLKTDKVLEELKMSVQQLLTIHLQNHQANSTANDDKEKSTKINNVRKEEIEEKEDLSETSNKEAKKLCSELTRNKNNAVPVFREKSTLKNFLNSTIKNFANDHQQTADQTSKWIHHAFNEESKCRIKRNALTIMKENPNINIDGFLRELLNKFPGYKVNEITLDIKRK